MKSIVLLLLAVISLLFISCTEENSKDEPLTPQEIKIMKEKATAGSDFPHNATFALKHGKKFKKNPKTCKKCHGKDLAGGSSKRSCKSCHKDFPHTKKFLKKGHGKKFLKKRVSCSNCHRPLNSGKLTNANCTKCHDYPHRKNWALAKKHGQASIDGKSRKEGINCDSCHKKSKKAEKPHANKNVSCDSCHVAMPHSSDFKEWEHAEVAAKSEGACLRCHTGYTRHVVSEDSGGACNVNCHEGSLQVKWNSGEERPK